MITEDDIENACDNLRMAILNLHMNMAAKQKDWNVNNYKSIEEEIGKVQRLVLKIMTDDATDSINKYV